MNVEIETEAVQFLFWEYINGIFFIVSVTAQKMKVTYNIDCSPGA
jgi:hypothetical protein